MADQGEQRRLAAIFAADMVGYSRLMEADERDTIARQKAHRAELIDPKIAEHNGRIVKLMGDGMLVEFASVVDAVECAVAVQRAMLEREADVPNDRRIRYRVGINLGDIVVEDEDIFGDGVNIAARLQEIAEPGGICISGTAYDQLKQKVEVGYEFLGEQQVKNITEPIRVYRVQMEASAGLTMGIAKSRVPGRFRAIAAIAASAAVLVAGFALWQLTDLPEELGLAEMASVPSADPVLALPTGPSIAVMPFDNLSGDPEQDYFAAGLSDSIISGLSLFPDFFVLARGTTFQFKGTSYDIRKVSQDLNARYLIQGSVQKSPGRIRVNVQLIDGETGVQLWAQTYDEELSATNVFEIQDNIRDQVAAMIAGETGLISRHETEQMRSTSTDSLEAYDCVLLARDHYDIFSPASHLKARDCLERAIKLDPDYAEAWAWLTYILADEDAFEFNPRPNALDRSLEAGLRAIRLDPTSAIAHAAVARTYAYRRDLENFTQHANRAVELSPNNVFVLVDMGQWLAVHGQWERGLAIVQKAMTLNPFHQGWYYIGHVYDAYRRREYEEAVAMAQKMDMPDSWYMHAFLAASYGQLGEHDKAQAAVDTLLSLYPDFPGEARDQYNKRLTSTELVERLLAGLRKAGLEIPDKAQ